jgi:mono/diheme cytochrome c family protein
MNRWSLLLAWLLPLNVFAASWCGPKETDLDQNWDCKTSADFWFTSQGSQLIPYKWFVNVEEANTTDLFATEKNLVGRFGYIAVPTWAQATVGDRNPDNLPIGFASDKDAKTGTMYLGFTCAACHTGQLKFPNITEPLIVNGGQGLGDFEKLLRELVQALEATIKDDAKFKRFATKIGTWPGDLRSQMKIESGRLRIRLDYNSPAVASGPGRVDAFGQIFNQVVAWTGGDHSPADAPVSYPSLWLAPKQDHVQWNGVASNQGNGPMLRNLGEVMGVFARFTYNPVPLVPFANSINKPNLNTLEKEIETLWPPRWPGSIDAGQKDAGAQIYTAKCQTCHPLNARTDVDPTNKIKVKILEDGTDPRMAQRFLDRSQATGKLRYWPAGSSQFQTPLLGVPTRGQLVLGSALLRVWVGPPGPLPTADNLPESTMDVLSTLVKSDLGYKAGPLNGIWATAPYLHNGSVPTLMELLSANRSQSGFCVGSRGLDGTDVGYQPDCIGEESKINLLINGNRNTGHTWGSELSDPQKRQLIEYLKSL